MEILRNIVLFVHMMLVMTAAVLAIGYISGWVVEMYVKFLERRDRR